MKITRKVLIITGLAALFGLATSCEQISRLTQFSMEYKESIEIPSTIGISLPFNLATPKITTNSEEIFEINDTRKHLIEKVVFEQLILKISSPDNSDFSFLKSMEIFITSDGLDELRVAWINDIDNSVGNSIILETSGQNLSSYIIADSFSLRFSTVSDKILLSDHQIEFDASFFVDAKILGL